MHLAPDVNPDESHGNIINSDMMRFLKQSLVIFILKFDTFILQHQPSRESRLCQSLWKNINNHQNDNMNGPVCIMSACNFHTSVNIWVFWGIWNRVKGQSTSPRLSLTAVNEAAAVCLIIWVYLYRKDREGEDSETSACIYWRLKCLFLLRSFTSPAPDTKSAQTSCRVWSLSFKHGGQNDLRRPKMNQKM